MSQNEVARLRAELERATIERQAAVNVMLQQCGAPTLDLQPRDTKVVPAQPKRNLPSIFRRGRELMSRIAATEKELSNASHS